MNKRQTPARHLRLASGLAAALLLSACATTPPALTDYTINSGAERAPEQLAVVFEKADLAWRVDPASRSIRGDATLTLLASAPLQRVVLDLDRNLPVDAVWVDGQALPASAYSNPNGRLMITLPQPLASGERTNVRVQYHGVPHVAREAPWDGGFVWSTAPTGEPWVATAVEGEGCDLFWPCIDHPKGKPQLVDEHITVPAPLVAVGNGVSLGSERHSDGWSTYHWRAKSPSTYGISLNIGPYQLLSADYASRYGNHIPLRFWYLRSNEAKAQKLFAEFPVILDFFEKAVGPYPFGDEKMGVVETPHKGMEHQTINAYGNKYVQNQYGYDDLLQHEAAHEWFGNQMTNSNWDDMWLHESFATYMQPMYVQYLHGEREYFATLEQQRLGIQNKAAIVSNGPRREEDVYNTDRGGPGGDIYVKGSLMLHTLRTLIGDDAFGRALRRLVYGVENPVPGKFQPRYSSSREFIAIVDKVTGRDMGWFFNVYLYQAALPELRSERRGDQLLLSWHTAGKDVFPMPVEVRVGERTVTLAMKDGRGQVTVPADTLYTIDPQSKVLKREEHIERFQQFKEAEKAAAKAAK
jgi:aminopeptidase N